jgi:hypothetical protein
MMLVCEDARLSAGSKWGNSRQYLACICFAELALKTCLGGWSPPGARQRCERLDRRQ